MKKKLSSSRMRSFFKYINKKGWSILQKDELFKGRHKPETYFLLHISWATQR